MNQQAPFPAVGNESLDLIFAAIADPTRRQMLGTLLRDGRTSVPALTAELPITRQAVAKHLKVLSEAGLVARLPSGGREVLYELAPGALDSASAWINEADRAWARRLDRLKQSVEQQRR